MNKMNETGLNEVAISLAAFKQCSEGDELVVLTEDGQVGWFVVEKTVAQRGRNGGTTVSLRDMVTNDPTTISLKNELPAGVARVRRVSAGVNARTMRKATAVVPAPKTAVTQPVGEFENILDVPDLEEAEPEAPQTPVVLENETFGEMLTEVLAPVEVAVTQEVVETSAEVEELTVEVMEAAFEPLKVIEESPTEEVAFAETGS